MTDAKNGVEFDLNSNGFAGRIAWTAPNSDDAWLFLDRNENNKVDNGSELFGNGTVQSYSPHPNGFVALAEYDKPHLGGNRDGVIDNNDAVFSSLRLWKDLNHNGISEPDELSTLLQLDVTSISLDYKVSKKTDRHGNSFRYRAKVDGVRHSRVARWAWEVFLLPAP